MHKSALAIAFLLIGVGAIPKLSEDPLIPVIVPIVKEEIDCLALNIYHEARGEILAGKVAVADVVLNRVKDKRYPDTICGVIYQSKLSSWWLEQGKEVPILNQCQFSWYCDGVHDKPLNNKAWQESKNIAKNILINGSYIGITEGATHYHASYVKPYWSTSKNMKLTAKIGDHFFYKQK